MSDDVWRWVITLALFAHGIGHTLFIPLLAPMLGLQTSGHSWLLTGPLGDGFTKGLASVIAFVALAGFVAAAAGVLAQAAWWRPLAIVAAAVSLVLVLAMWDGLPTSSAFAAVAFDVVVLIALLVAHWPSERVVGA